MTYRVPHHSNRNHVSQLCLFVYHTFTNGLFFQWENCFARLIKNSTKTMATPPAL